MALIPRPRPCAPSSSSDMAACSRGSIADLSFLCPLQLPNLVLALALRLMPCRILPRVSSPSATNTPEIPLLYCRAPSANYQNFPRAGSPPEHSNYHQRPASRLDLPAASTTHLLPGRVSSHARPSHHHVCSAMMRRSVRQLTCSKDTHTVSLSLIPFGHESKRCSRESRTWSSCLSPERTRRTMKLSC
ncbi:hypothetical protein BKA81DRAFT_174624 [Phyllosticta paracitricarpa]